MHSGEGRHGAAPKVGALRRWGAAGRQSRRRSPLAEVVVDLYEVSLWRGSIGTGGACWPARENFRFFSEVFSPVGSLPGLGGLRQRRLAARAGAPARFDFHRYRLAFSRAARAAQAVNLLRRFARTAAHRTAMDEQGCAAPGASYRGPCAYHYRNTHAWFEAGRLHHQPPLFTVRLAVGAVALVHGRVRGFVAQDFVHQVGLGADQRWCKPDQPIALVTAPEGTAQSRRELDAQIARQTRDLPRLEPALEHTLLPCGQHRRRKGRPGTVRTWAGGRGFHGRGS